MKRNRERSAPDEALAAANEALAMRRSVTVYIAVFQR
jgi:hypothetical protein